MTDSTSREQMVGSVLTGLVKVSRLLSASRLTPFGETSLTRTQLDILFFIAHADGPVSPGNLAEALRVTPGAITQAVDQLRRLELVQQRPSAHDARFRVLDLTGPARDRVDAFEADVIDRVAPRFAALSETELDDLARLLGKVRTA